MSEYYERLLEEFCFSRVDYDEKSHLVVGGYIDQYGSELFVLSDNSKMVKLVHFSRIDCVVEKYNELKGE